MPDTETTEPAESAQPLTGAEHLAWCKERALEYADQRDTASAISSLVQDLGLHPETAGSVDVVIHLMTPLAMTGEFERPGELRKFIEGF
jgi:uncharacterized protein (DUF1684 family)